MQKHTAEELVEASKGSEHELTLYENYSSRGMHGEQTFGVVGDLAGLLLAVFAMGQVDFPDEGGKYNSDEQYDIHHDLANIRQDNLGRDTIWY